MRLKETLPTKALALLFLFGFLLTASAQDFQIRTRVDLVVVPVTVKGSNGVVATGLRRDDFAVFENGKRQVVTNFSVDPVPISAAILVDTGLSVSSYEKVYNSFPALAGAFSDFDEIAVYRFDKFVTRLLDFTNDKLLVETTLRKLEEPSPAGNPTITGGPFSAIGPVINGVPASGGGPEPGTHAAPPGAKLLHDAIFTAAGSLAQRKVDRRRIILVVSDGQAKGDIHSFQESVNQLLDRGIQIYAVGLDSSFFSRRFSVLNAYAQQTGGDACFLNSQRAMEACYVKSTEEARNQYILGYVSNNKVSGLFRVFRDIDVRVEKPGLETRHRKGYFQYP